ncbi:MAG: DUF362 domain-containing protein [Anaerolineae bacterium]|nr:DUF362 domain-containing protein [Anaerolineae bacterium]
MSQVAFVKTKDRTAGVARALDLLGFRIEHKERWFVKPNLNSADRAPGSTHNDVLRAIVSRLKDGGAAQITVGDRSGMGDTRTVMQQKGIFRLAEELGLRTVVFDELGAADWVPFTPPNGHWQRGFAVARPVLEADGVIQACCLKTHRYGGHFTLSLKNSVGLVAKTLPGEGYNYMSELHSSPHQRSMIAEINAAYTPDLVVLDGVEAFAEGGPAQGRHIDADVILASRDRVAIDAVGVALLRHYGTTPEVSRGKIFEQEQIAIAAHLGLGVTLPQQIELVTGDADSEVYAARIQEILDQG